MSNKYFDDKMGNSMLTIVETRRLYSIYKKETKSLKINFDEFCKMVKILYISKKPEIENSDLSLYDFFENMFKSYKDNCVEIIEKDEEFEGEICVPINLTIKIYCEAESKFELIDSIIKDIKEAKIDISKYVRSSIFHGDYEIDEEHIHFIESQ